MAIKLNYEIPPEISEKALEAIEVAKTSGKIKKGVNEVTKTIERGKAKLVVVAEDIDPEEVVMHFPPLCEEKSTPLILAKSKKELGAAAGLSVQCSAVAVVEEGDAKDLIKEIAESTKGGKKE